MATYVLRRLLLMIPTFFGISVVVWLVMAAAPVERSKKSVSMEEGIERDASGADEARKNFEAQFDLDKPTLLNFYYDIAAQDVRDAVADVADVDNSRSVKQRAEAQEQLVRWGTYAVPQLFDLVHEANAGVRDTALAWLIANGTRVPRVPPGGRVEPEQAVLNAAIRKDNATLRRLKWPLDAPPRARAAASLRALAAWYDGARAEYPAGMDDGSVRAAVEASDEARMAEWGPRAVAPLVEIVGNSSGPVRDRALAWLVRTAARPAPAGAREEERLFLQLHNATVADLAWKPTDPETVKDGGALRVREWWSGAGGRWDYGGSRWLHVLFLETKFASYWAKLLRLDLGVSFVHRVPVVSLIAARLKYSLTLALTSLILAYLISIPIGILSATWHGSIGERATTLMLFMLYSLPSFFVATLLLRYLAIGTPWKIIPDSGFESMDSWKLTTWERIKDVAHHVAAPIFCMTYASFAALSRYAKTGLLDVIRSDYVRTARAKGLSEFWVIGKHATRNGIIPIITLLGTTLPVLVAGSIVIETIFAIPGFGRLTITSIFNRDYNVIIGVQLIVAVLVMLGILLSDILYAIVDPRITYS